MALDRRFALLMWLAKQSGRAFYPGASVRGMRRGAVAANRRFGIRDPGGVAARALSRSRQVTVQPSLRASIVRATAETARCPCCFIFTAAEW
jgi:hypothetical protein